MQTSHVVIVDDDPAARDSVAALLKAFQFEITAFDSAEAFLDGKGAVCAGRSCLLIDVQLPGMSGRELQKALNHLGNAAPLILISGYVDPTFTQEAIEDGASAVLEKPVEPWVLVDHVKQALRSDIDAP